MAGFAHIVVENRKISVLSMTVRSRAWLLKNSAAGRGAALDYESGMAREAPSRT
jgi:hypothetical protein